jgi:rRNA-processing protein CGR1
MLTLKMPAAVRSRSRQRLARIKSSMSSIAQDFEAPDWVPPQHELIVNPQDFRGIKRGPKGYKEKNNPNLKRKLEADVSEDAMDEDEAAPGAGADHDPMQQDDDGLQSSKRRKQEGAKYVPIYERQVKKPASRAGKVMKGQTGGGGSTAWEKKMKEKALRAAFVEQKKETIALIKEKKKQEADRRKAVKERREANKTKSQVTQKITNNATLKKMMKNKKQKKTLKKADTN